MADEMKEAATKLIKEFGLVLQYPLEVRNNHNSKANFYLFLSSKISILISKLPLILIFVPEIFLKISTKQ